MLLAELLLAAALVMPRLTPLLLLACAAGLAVVVARWPIVGAVGLLLLAASVLAQGAFAFPLGSVELRGYELAVVGLLVLAAVAPRDATWGGAAGLCLAAFLGWLGIATWLALSSGATTLSDAVAWGRPFAMFALVFVVIRLFGQPRQLNRLLVAGAVIGALTGAVALAVAVAPATVGMLGPGAEDFVTTSGVWESLSRIRMPGVALAYALFIFAVVRLIAGRGRARAGWALVLAGMTLNLVLSFNRNMWIGLLFGLALLLVLGGVRLRRRVLAGGVAVVVGVTLIFAVGIDTSRGSRLDPLVERATTLLDPQAVQRENSLVARRNEADRAWAVFREHPLTGIGPGTSFGVYFGETLRPGVTRISPQLFLHNQYQYLLLIGGLPLLLLFLGFLGAALRASWRARATPEALAMGIGTVMMALSAFVMISFASPDQATALALVAGAALAYGRHHGGART